MKVTILKIPKSVKEIVNVFIRFNFNPLTYKIIADTLNKDTNTIIQRIKRNEANFFEISGKRPYQIRLRQNVKEIYFYRDHNQCQICKKTLNLEKLILRFKNPIAKDKYAWNNVFTCCQECKNKNTHKKRTRKIQQIKASETDLWEYKEIRIKEIYSNPSFQANFDPNLTSWSDITPQYINPYIVASLFKPVFHKSKVKPDLYYEFYEPDEKPDLYYEFYEPDEDQWFHLANDDDEITSTSLAKLLNYFGDDGWELVSILREGSPFLSAYRVNPFYNAFNREEFYNCIFKRKVREVKK